MKKTGTSTHRTSTRQHMKNIIISIFTLIAISSQAQPQRTITLDQAIEEALQNNGSIKASQYHLDARKQLQKASFDLPKIDVNLLYGQYNSYANDNNITVTQTIPFSAFGSQGALNRALTTSATLQKSVSENEIIFQVKQVYFQLAFAKARHLLLLRQDSIYEGFMKAASATLSDRRNLFAGTNHSPVTTERSHHATSTESSRNIQTTISAKDIDTVAGYGGYLQFGIDTDPF